MASVIILVVLLSSLFLGCSANDSNYQPWYQKAPLYVWDGLAWVDVNTAIGAGGGTGNVTATDIIADDSIVRGDGGVRGIQGSIPTIDNTGAIDMHGSDFKGSDIYADNNVYVTNDLDVTDDADIGGDLDVIGSITGEISSPTGRTAVFTIAASNSNAQVISQSDYICDGVEDQVQLQDAIDALPAYGGKIHMASGLYNFTATVNVTANHAWIEGEGYRPYGTMIYLNDNSDCNMFDVSADKVIFSYLEINGNSVNQGAGTWHGIYAHTDASDLRVDSCYFWYVDGYAMYVTGNSVYFKASYTMTEHCGGGTWCDAYRYHLVGCASFHDTVGFNFSANLGNASSLWISNTTNGIIMSGNYTTISGVTAFETRDTILITGEHNLIDGVDSYWASQQFVTMTGANYNTLSDFTSYLSRQTSVWIEGSSYNKLSNFNMTDSCAGGASYAVLYLRTSGVASTYNTIENFVSVNPNEVNKPKYGIYEANAFQDYNEYINCRFDNIATYEWLLQGVNSRRFDNKYATIGTVANHTEIDEDGLMTMVGDARVIKGDWIDAGAIKAPGAKPALAIAWGTLEVPAWEFEDQAVVGNQETISFSFKVPEDMDRTVEPIFNVGWASASTTGSATWQLEYLWTSLNEDTTAGAQETLSGVSPVSGTANGLVVTIITGIDIPSATDACMHCKFTRLSADVTDTLTDDANVLGICLRYTANKLGS